MTEPSLVAPAALADGRSRPTATASSPTSPRTGWCRSTRRLLADAETPISVYRKLAAGRSGTFLLESAEHGGVWSRYSFVGVRSAATLSERDGDAVWTGIGPDDHPDDPLAALQRRRGPAAHRPPARTCRR